MTHSDDAKIAWGKKEEGDELFEKGDFEELSSAIAGLLNCFHEIPISGT